MSRCLRRPRQELLNQPELSRPGWSRRPARPTVERRRRSVRCGHARQTRQAGTTAHRPWLVASPGIGAVIRANRVLAREPLVLEQHADLAHGFLGCLSSQRLGLSVRRGGSRRGPTVRASAVVIRPAKTNAVCRSDDSRSNGSSAETASRGITTSYQRSAALAAVWWTQMFATVLQITRVRRSHNRSRRSRGAVERVAAKFAKDDARPRAGASSSTISQPQLPSRACAGQMRPAGSPSRWVSWL